MSPAEYRRFQTRVFRECYSHALRTSDHYATRREVYPDLPAVGGFELLKFLEGLPVVSKEEVRRRPESFWASNHPFRAPVHTTSGTSGTPLRIRSSIGERSLSQAILQNWFARLCRTRRPRTLFLSGFMSPSEGSRELFWRDPLTQSVFLSIYSLGEKNRDRVRRLLKSFDPNLVYGYASAVHQLARLTGPGCLKNTAGRAAVTTSEVLYPDWRNEIGEALGARVYNLYGSQEGCHLVLECPQGGMHIHPLIGIVEIVDEANRGVLPGQMGRVLVTGLNRRTMPLIRYDLEDWAESTGYDTHCPCGLGWPTIGRVVGRSEDLVVKRSGERIGYLCFHATKNLKGIVEAQLVQTGFQRFVMNVVLDSHCAAHSRTTESAVRGEITRRMGEPVEIEFRYVPTVPRSARGKFKAVVVDFQWKGPSERGA